MLRTITVVSKPMPVRKPAHSRATSEMFRTVSLHGELPKHIAVPFIHEAASATLGSDFLPLIFKPIYQKTQTKNKDFTSDF